MDTRVTTLMRACKSYHYDDAYESSHEDRGSFTAETAAGLYLEERQSTVKCLMLLLQDVLQQDLSPQDPPSCVRVFCIIGLFGVRAGRCPAYPLL
eukprot:1160365-Pelagomonas_calceolata.AAC.10